MLKRMRTFLILTFSALLLLTGCTVLPGAEPPGGLDPKNPVTVTLWHYYVGENQKEFDETVSEFNRTIGVEKGVVVDAVGMGSISELESQITSSAKGVINAKPMPQIFSSYPDKAMEIDGYGVLVNLNDYFTPEEKELYVADFLADGIFEGDRLLSLPVVKSTELVYLNWTGWEEFAAACGVTQADLTGWETIFQTARTYYRWSDGLTPDVPWDGKALTGFDSVANYIIACCKQLGVNVIDSDRGESGCAVLDRQVLRRIFDLYYQGVSLGYFMDSERSRSDDIRAGSTLSYVGSSSRAAYFPTWVEQNNRQLPIEFRALPYPVFDGGANVAIQQGAGMCVAQSTPAQQEGAVLFLKWFTAVERNIPFAMTTGYLPVQTGAYASPLFDSALGALRTGDQARQNVAEVYEVALRQITRSNTYAASPFQGSYDVRSVLQSTLIAMGEQGKEEAMALMAQGATEEEILLHLNRDGAFQNWIERIEQALKHAGVECQVV